MTGPAGSRVRRAAAALPAAVSRVRRRPPAPTATTVVLSLLAVLSTLAGAVIGVEVAPVALLVLPLLGAALLLERRPTQVVLAVVAGCLAFDVVAHGVGASGVRVGTAVVLLVTAVVAYEVARSREETGLSAASGTGLIVELRARLQQQGATPPLPPGWSVDVAVRPADGGPFAGDFVASALTGGGEVLELVLVDVSGKGVDAGTRALLLSGAFGGLLGAVPPAGFLPAANAYLVRQDWDEGFATAVHVALTLSDGRFSVVSAGHPPAAVFDAGSGRWSLVEASGPALGLLREVGYTAVSGRLEPGDALMLYTDGLVEVPGRDLSVGTDRLLGEAERLVAGGFRGGADALITRVSARGGTTDDRGLVLLRRG